MIHSFEGIDSAAQASMIWRAEVRNRELMLDRWQAVDSTPGTLWMAKMHLQAFLELVRDQGVPGRIFQAFEVRVVAGEMP